jgi:processive 1,2-diacylglycerol beta-glucosyltransferase
MNKKILITYATAGVGHKKASLAIKAALENKKTDFDITFIDVLDYTNSFFKKSYPSVYLLLINKLIFLWGFLYYLLDFKIVHNLFYPLRQFSGVLNGMRFVRFLLEFRPDIVIATHFLTADICTYVKQKYKIKMKVINVVTDYRIHSFWIADGVDTYIVGHQETKMDLLKKWGVPSHKIKVMGIPVEPKFSIKHDKNFFRGKLNLPADSFVVLLLGGGYGVGPILKILKILNKSILRLRSGLSVITVCGHNESLYNKVNTFAKKINLTIRNYAYVDNIDELMAASDVYIGKAGGISTTEALNQDLPLIFVRPIPGQESRNALLMTKGGAGIKLKKISDIVKIVEELKHSEEKVKALKESINNIKKINAANDIADFVTQQ